MAIRSSASDENSVVTIVIEGRFDFAAHQAFKDSYKDYPRGERRFVVDLENTEYIDSSAMGMLLQLREHGDSEARIRLVKGNEAIREILQIANFDKLFEVA